jgi:hypothetical protein
MRPIERSADMRCAQTVVAVPPTTVVVRLLRGYFMATISFTADASTERDAINRAIDACRCHQACTAQVLRQRLEPIHEHLVRDRGGGVCHASELRVIEDALTWFAGIGPVPQPELTRGLVSIRDPLARCTVEAAAAATRAQSATRSETATGAQAQRRH